MLMIRIMAVAAACVCAGCGGGGEDGSKGAAKQEAGADAGTESEAYRLLTGLTARLPVCAENPGYQVFSSVDELVAVMDDPATRCPPENHEEWKQEFLGQLRREGIRWEEESLVIAGEWYGTGAARARLDLSPGEARTVNARIVWELPPPPHTPDTAVCDFRFAVNRRDADAVRIISGRTGEETVLPLRPER